MNTLIFLAAADTSGQGLFTLIMLVAVVVIFYFFMIRPQKKQEKETAAMRNSLRVGDEITTIGGIIGKIVSIKDPTCIIETGRDGTKIRILKSAVKQVDVPAAATVAPPEEKEEAKEELKAPETDASEAEESAEAVNTKPDKEKKKKKNK